MRLAGIDGRAHLFGRSARRGCIASAPRVSFPVASGVGMARCAVVRLPFLRNSHIDMKKSSVANTRSGITIA